jgi:hypothetical protein
MPLVLSLPAVALQRACVPYFADRICTLAPFGSPQWFYARWVATLILAEALKRPHRQGPPTAVGRGESFVDPQP